MEGDDKDSLDILTRKVFTHLCTNRGDDFVKYFEKTMSKYPIMKIYKFISKSITFLYALCVWNTIDYVKECPKLSEDEIEEINENFKHKQFDMNLLLPEYVYDKHTKSSKQENRDYKHFIENCILNPRGPEMEYERRARKLYIDSNIGVGGCIKRVKDGLNNQNNRTNNVNNANNQTNTTEQNDTNDTPNQTNQTNTTEQNDTNDTPNQTNQTNTTEQNDTNDTPNQHENENQNVANNTPTNQPTDKIQTQLITGAHKPRTWFYSPNNDNNFNFILKGPCKDIDIKTIIISGFLKSKLFNEPRYICSKVIIDNNAYVKMPNFIPINPTNTIITSSSLERNVVIYNGNKYLFNKADLDNFDDDKELMLLLLLLYRKVVGSNDTCDRNIINIDTLYSVDDPVLLKETRYMYKIELNAKYKVVYGKLLTKHWDSINTKITEWKNMIRNDKEIVKHVSKRIINYMDRKLDAFRNRNEWKF